MRLLWIFIGVMALITATSALAAPLCFPDSTNQLCKDPYVSNGNFYCAVEDVVKCPSGSTCKVYACVSSTGTFIPECTNGQETCGRGEVEDPNGDHYRCVLNKWQKVEDCGSRKCKEFTFSKAECVDPLYYCYQDYRCITTSQLGANCYTTLAD